jgi:hypothetical protein
MIMLAVRIALTSLAVLLLAEPLHAQDSLAAARELYASAQYDEALEVLEKLSTGASSNGERQSIDLYRTLCLFAVGRRDDADRAIEAMIARDPLYRLGDDLSPRTRSAFSDAKRRVLPAIVQQQYAEAKVAFERKQYEPAAAAFKRVIDALNDPDIGSAANQPPLSDLRTLAAGFYDLSVKSIPPPPPPAPAPMPPVNVPARIYTIEDPGVRPPLTIAQELPRFLGPVPPGGFKGMVEVLINEKGTVESAAMIVPVTSAYDKSVLTAASQWLFQPARLNGAAVKFRKRLQITITPPTR